MTPTRPEAVLAYHQLPADIIEDCKSRVWARKSVVVALAPGGQVAPAGRKRGAGKEARKTRHQTPQDLRLLARAPVWAYKIGQRPTGAEHGSPDIHGAGCDGPAFLSARAASRPAARRYREHQPMRRAACRVPAARHPRHGVAMITISAVQIFIQRSSRPAWLCGSDDREPAGAQRARQQWQPSAQ